MAYSRIQKMLLGIAIGDAFGAGYEFAYEDIASYHNVRIDQYLRHPNNEIKHSPGDYTDDTQMSIAVCELLASKKDFTRENLADYFVKCYKRNPIQGYSRRIKDALEFSSNGSELLSGINKNSTGNGAAMRSVPFGLINNLDEVIEYAKINASVTHDTPKGIASSIAVALASYYNFHERRMPEISTEIVPHIKRIDEETADYLLEVSGAGWLDLETVLGKENANKGIPCDGMRTAGAVLFILKTYNQPISILANAVRFGGDTDSVASISLGINMINNNITELPKWMIETLTNHKYGRDYILTLGNRMNKIF